MMSSVNVNHLFKLCYAAVNRDSTTAPTGSHIPYSSPDTLM